jgi:hypothetical protein
MPAPHPTAVRISPTAVPADARPSGCSGAKAATRSTPAQRSSRPTSIGSTASTGPRGEYLDADLITNQVLSESGEFSMPRDADTHSKALLEAIT